ncbi:MAG TPA: anti-sigma regulatory factor [Candidatus Angelobacter sp.]|nr:anti-sigma regulatory factor [Candidatus Angelobacter sp.]
METTKRETKVIQSSADVVIARQAVRAWTLELKFGLVDQTKMVTAASELARNTLEHGGGGSMTMELINNGVRKGLRLIFEDRGPGIPNIERALEDGFTTKSGMGLGLGGSRKLVNDFEISSKAGEGTRVTVTRWK